MPPRKNKGAPPPPHSVQSSAKTEPPVAGSVSLASGDTLVDQDLNHYPTVLGPTCLSLVRCRCSVFAHGTRRHDMPHRYVALLDEVIDDCLSTVLAQFRVHRSAAARIGIAHHFDDVSSQPGRGLRQLAEFLLVLR